MGFIYLYFDWDWASAEPELRRAIALDPEDANAYHSYSHYLVSAGRLPESLEISKQALEVDPLDARLLWHRTWNQFMARNFPEAIAVGQKVALLHPDPQCCGAYLAWAYEETGEYQKAIAARERFGMPRDAAQELRRALEKGGSRGYWQTLLNEDLKREGYVGPYFRTRSYAHLKEFDQAFEWLNRGIQERDSWMVYLNVDPTLDTLRGDPRFPKLVRMVGIPTK
jgi:tetratricopeptide (TPR) repeat protein